MIDDNLKSLINQVQKHQVNNVDPSLYAESAYHDDVIIPIGSDNLDDIAKTIITSANKVNFKSYHQNLGGNATRYYKNMVFTPPNRIIAVIANDYTISLFDKIGFAIGQLHNNDTDIKIAYIFNGRKWLSVSESWIRNLLHEVLKKMGHDPVECRTSNMMMELIKTFWNNCPKTPCENTSNSFINLANVTVEILSNGEVITHPHNKMHFLLYCLPYNYEKEKVINIFMWYIDRVLDKESQLVLQELLGSIFIKDINLEKIGILYGSGSNGKSVLLKIILALLGEDNVSQMDLRALTTDNNAANNRSHLMGKLLNFASEINARGEQAHDLIKRMASGEAIQVKLLYQNTITISDYAKLIFNANTLPNDVEHSHGFFRRLLIIHFDQTITEEEVDLELANKIIASELPGILNWIIEGAQRLQKQKKFSQCKKSDAIIAKYKLEADVVAMFIEENNYVASESPSSELSKLYDKLKTFCSNNGYKTISIRTFADRLRALGFKTNKPKGSNTKVYIEKN